MRLASQRIYIGIGNEIIIINSNMLNDSIDFYCW